MLCSCHSVSPLGVSLTLGLLIILQGSAQMPRLTANPPVCPQHLSFQSMSTWLPTASLCDSDWEHPLAAESILSMGQTGCQHMGAKPVSLSLSPDSATVTSVLWDYSGGRIAPGVYCTWAPRFSSRVDFDTCPLLLPSPASRPHSHLCFGVTFKVT